MVLCKIKDCKTRAYYNKKGEGTPIHCGKHREGDEINIKKKRCIELHCDKYALYAIPNEKIALYCKTHAKNGMVDIKTNVCKCGIGATFGFENDDKATCCKLCKKNGMINIKDVKCDFVDENGIKCKTRANYGKEGEKKCRCVKHKDENMIDVSHKKCEFNGCKTRPTFGIEKATHCVLHKDENMKNILDKKCAMQLCDTIIHGKFDKYCYRCFTYLNPKSELSKRTKKKENEVVKFIKENFNEYLWIVDKIIEYGCSRKKPDLFLQFGSHVIIIEIDELQHRGYNCETARIGELWNDLNWQTLVIIRFNPDAYLNKKGIRVKSPWGCTEKRGLLKIINNDEWIKRLNKLKKYVEFWIKNVPKNNIEIIYLYYDYVKEIKDVANEEIKDDENLKSVK